MHAALQDADRPPPAPPRARHRLLDQPLATALFALLSMAALYFGGGALLLRFDLDRLAFPRTRAPAVLQLSHEAFRVPTSGGGAMIVRRFGDERIGCVVFFPGQHGGVERYAASLFPDLQRAGFAVYAVAYPGQDGAPGHASLAAMPGLAARVVQSVMDRCGAARTVVAGRSLGAMVAAYGAGAAVPAGAVLEAASPTLGTGLRAHLRGRWFLRPLALLPIERLLRRDYALAEALPPELRVVIFQGGADAQAPIADLHPETGGPAHTTIIEVPDGRHADTFERARAQMVATMVDMVRTGGKPAAD